MRLKNYDYIFGIILLFFVGGCYSDVGIENEVYEDQYIELRNRMIEEQLLTRDITNDIVIEAIRNVPRHRLMHQYVHLAYEDRPVPIGYDQTISQPYIVALMTQILNPNEDDIVLEIGTGSGYQAAVLAEIVDTVYTIEIIEELAMRAENDLKELGYDNINVLHADGYYGWPEDIKFDSIIITASPNHVPPPLIEQLKEGGVMVVPVATAPGFQTLNKITKINGTLDTEVILGVRFVPMTGRAQQTS